jgi:hypothetical protein
MEGHMDKAIELLKAVLDKGYKSEGLLTDSTWNISIELKWEIERFIQESGEGVENGQA